MADVRYGLRNDDLTTTGGVIFATGKMRFHGKEVAAEGDLATCPACKAMGKIVNDAYPAFGLPGGRQLAIQGAWIFCKCANPPRTIASTDKFRVTVNRAGSAAPAPASARPSFAVPQAEQNAYAQRGMEKLTGTQSSLIDDPELICPNMTDAQFGKHMMGLRDDALVQVDDRLRQLARWSQADQAWFLLWFGTTDQTARSTIANGLTKMRRALGLLTPSNFVRYTDEMTTNPGPGGCISRNSPGSVAEVCAPDTATHTIVIKLDFCVLRDRHPQLDSQLLTLVHEVSHFNDVFSSRDIKYSTYSAKIMAKSKDERTIINADNIAGYVICSE